jgi:hypothetical protein
MASTHASAAGAIQPHQNNTPLKVKLVIHHQFPGIELVSPTYASRRSTCCLLPDQRIDVGSTMQASFNIDLTRNRSIGVLMYKLQRKNSDQSNGDLTFSANEATCTQLVVIWKINSSKEFRVVSRIIEHDQCRIWDRDKLMKLTKLYKLYDIQHGPVEETWLMQDNTALRIRDNMIHEKTCYKLEITISKTSIKDDARRPWCFDVDR